MPLHARTDTNTTLLVTRAHTSPTTPALPRGITATTVLTVRVGPDSASDAAAAGRSNGNDGDSTTRDPRVQDPSLLSWGCHDLQPLLSGGAGHHASDNDNPSNTNTNPGSGHHSNLNSTTVISRHYREYLEAMCPSYTSAIQNGRGPPHTTDSSQESGNATYFPDVDAFSAHIEPAFRSTFFEWADSDGWIDEAYVSFYYSNSAVSDVTHTAGGDSHDCVGPVESVHLFSTRPVLVFLLGNTPLPPELNPARFPRLIVARAPVDDRLHLWLAKIRYVCTDTACMACSVPIRPAHTPRTQSHTDTQTRTHAHTPRLSHTDSHVHAH